MSKIYNGRWLQRVCSALLVFLLVTLISVADAQVSEAFREYHLVLPITNLGSGYEGDLCIILKKEQQNMNQLRDSSFTVISPSGRIAHAEITGMTGHPFDLMGNLAEYPVGILKFTENRFDTKRTGAMLGVAGKSYTRERVGRAQLIDNFETRYSDHNNFIKMQLPEKNQFSITASRLEMPDSDSAFIYTRVEHFDPEEYRKAGDHALQRISFLFKDSESGQVNRLDLQEDDLLSNIYTVTDLDADGQVELLVRTSTGFDGTYEIRLLKEGRLSPAQTKLYEWGH
jgi:hypothetical protein